MIHIGKNRPEDARESAGGSGARMEWRGLALAVLGAITLGVAVLSVVVSYRILEPRFGHWAYAIVAALDALWVVFQAAEVLAGNNRSRAMRARSAGLVLTAVLTAMPTVDLIRAVDGHFELSVVLTPVAIALTKVAWTVALPALGRRVSEETRATLADRRQEVADQLEVMEAAAADRIEFLSVAARLEEKVAAAETAYRKSALKSQQATAQDLRKQAGITAEATAKPLPASVTDIALPDFGTWSPVGALPGTAPARAVTQVNARPLPPGTPAVTDGGTAAHDTALTDLAAVAGVPVPVPGDALTDGQVGVVLRHLRYSDDPPLSYRQAREQYRTAGYVGSEERVRRVWGEVIAQESTGPAEGAETGPSPSQDEEPDEEPSRPAGQH
ncbi:hypothetical protein ACFVFF_38800 [Streptomyces sp. NPDC057680]|uniref:hypothetical protein n=1 Tax=Streptomyces sp. NPDC057680 TaxID=3346208 RepID=UPI0036A9DE33